MSLSQPKIKVCICLGTACFVMGATELQTLVDEAPDHWNDIFDFICVPCLELCDKRRDVGAMPFVTIDDKPYADMSGEKLRRLLQSFVDKIDRTTIG